MAESIKVAVRVRPFNQREKDLGSTVVVEMVDATTKVGEKSFTYDFSYWSHNPDDANYASQDKVHSDIGSVVLANALNGFNGCLFAYGQTGAGKSYSMVGYGANKGIVPISCSEIFKRIEQNNDPGLSYEVMVSMIEIYNEQVQDLLLEPKLRPRKGLEIRESQQLGIYVAGVIKRPVDSYPAIEAVIEDGTANRTVGATLMNATSSRAHTVLTIEFKQVSEAVGQKGVKISLINLVDLAGSEKAGQTGASGDRLKEGCSINKSLSALGNVIERLADKATGKAKANAIIPYRDSKLTRLLQNALGGSSKTIMICAISPASSNHDETLSTLRYADRAKRIKNAAAINEDPQDRIIRQLREENAMYKSMAEGVVAPGDMALKQSEISALEEALREMQKDFAQKLREAQEARAKEPRQGVDLTKPHITNLNEDALLTNKLHFAFPEGTTEIGKSASGYEPQIALAGVGIQQKHALVTNTGGKCALAAEALAAETTFVNGEKCSASRALKHGDRIVFGQSFFIFIDTKSASMNFPPVSAEKLLNQGKVGYEMARKELAEKQGGFGPMKSPEDIEKERQQMAEMDRRIAEAEEAKRRAEAESQELLRRREEEHQRQAEEMQRALDERLQAQSQEEVDRQKREHEEQMQQLQRDFEERQKAAEAAAQQRIDELENRARELNKEEREIKQRDLDMKLLEDKIGKVMQLAKEANLIAAELARPFELETKIHVEPSCVKRGTVQVAVGVKRDGVLVYEWPPETLENRVFLMRELLERCDMEGFCVEDLQEEEDPWWDPIRTERLIGVAQILLESLKVQIENELDAKILSTEGRQAGALRLEIWPIAQDGSIGVPDQEAVMTPRDLLGTKMEFLLKVVGAQRLPDALANDVRVEYHYFLDDDAYHVPPSSGHCTSPQFNYERRFTQDPVTTKFLEYLQTPMVFRVYGHDSEAMALRGGMQTPPIGATRTPQAEAEAATDPTEPTAAAESPAPEAPAPEEPWVGPHPAQVVDSILNPGGTPGASPTKPHDLEQATAEGGEPSPPCAAPAEVPSVSELRSGLRKAEEDIPQTEPQPGGRPSQKGSKTCAIL